MKNPRYSEFKWLIRQTRPLVWLYLGSLGCIIFGSLMALLDPLVMKWLLDDVLPRRDMRMLWVAAGLFFLIYICRLLSSTLGGLLSFRATQKIVFRIRLRLLRDLQSLPAKYHDNTPVGDTVYRLEQDVEQIGQLGGDFIPTSLRLALMITLIVITMFIMNWQLTCIVLPLAPIFLLVQYRYRNVLRAHSDRVQKRMGQVSGFLHEHLSSISQVQLLTRETIEARRFASLAWGAMGAQRKRREAESTFILMSLSFAAVGSTLILGYGGYQVIVGSLTIGGLVAFYSYLTRLFDPLGGTVETISKMQRAGASIRRVVAIMQENEPLKDSPGAIAISPSLPASIELQNVCFAYRADRSVLTDVSLRIEPGERVALVGANGSGKSTIGKLLTRLYDVNGGAVMVGGIDVRGIRVKSLRSTVAFVPQQPVLFNATLRENILYGSPKASLSQLEEAAEVAQLQGLIELLPQGWDELVGPRGSSLSGGERQRVALARAALQNSGILILDESTAGLDATAEREFLRALDSFAVNKTVLVISHQLATILWADRVVVLAQGRVLEEGTHETLYRKGGAYYQLYTEEIEREANPVEAMGVLDGS
jgi:ABC-type multidrug transport system fused ATPase/permease subunit